jgi:hypothetical protein
VSAAELVYIAMRDKNLDDKAVRRRGTTGKA